MGMYDPLTRYLSKQSEGSCTLTFSEVEDIIRARLPRSARSTRSSASWWGNDKTHTQAVSWLRAGWKTDGKPDLHTEQVRFVRSDNEVRSAPSGANGNSQVIVRNLDPDVVTALKRKARQNGTSLERELRMILTRAARPERAELIAEADRIRAMTPGILDDSVELLREDRDSR